MFHDIKTQKTKDQNIARPLLTAHWWNVNNSFNPFSNSDIDINSKSGKVAMFDYMKEKAVTSKDKYSKSNIK